MRYKRLYSLSAAVLISSLSLSLSSQASFAAKDDHKTEKTAAPSAQIEDSKRAVHALNRLTFGARPGDVSRVNAIGVDKWIELQLTPEKIDDSALQARLEPFRTLNMDTKTMLAHFPPPPVLKAIADGRIPMPRDPKVRSIYQAQLEAYKARQQDKVRSNGEARADEMKPSSMSNPQGIIINELVQAKLLRAIHSERQLEEVLVDFWFNHFNIYIAKGADRYLTTSYEREAIRKHAMGKFEDLLIATAKDPAMLFYLDNFQSVGPNSIAGKRSGSAFFAKGNGGQLRRQRFRQDTERPQLSSETTANRMSEDDDVQKGAPKRGLNENYARELMELHTMGVDGGYTQHDIVEVAKVFTGWTARQPRLGGDFEFNSRIHEPGNKKVLGVVIKEDGENEGKKVLHMLATHPATAKFISRKLAMRFVSDAPPQALVDRMAATFLKSEGDIKQVLRTLFKSPEFWAQDAYRAKVKTPLEFVVSAVRATGTEVKNAQVLARTLQTMGMPLYGMQPPTGYSMKAEAWVNSAALLNRMNFGLALATGRLRGLDINGSTLLDRPSSNDTEDVFATLAKALLAGDVSRQTQETVRKQMDESQKADSQSVMPEKHSRFSLATGMILGSPEFQRR